MREKTITSAYVAIAIDYNLLSYFCNFVAIFIKYVAIMDTMQLQYRATLKINSHSDTATRYRVFECLCSSQSPLSITELSDKLKGKVDRSSVYRTVELFERLGIVKKVYIGWRYRLELGDDYRSHHHHMTCIGCGKILPLSNQKLESALRSVGRDNKFLITDHLIELRGYCRSCQN